MSKSEIYSWRLSPQMKRRLEEAARRQRQSISALLENIVRQFFRGGGADWDEDETARQERLHAAAFAAIGKIQSGRTDRSIRAREDLRRKLQRKHERARAN